MSDDEETEFPPQRMAGQDAEIAADIGDDDADRPAADLGCDLLRRGQGSETRVCLVAARIGGPGGTRPTLRRRVSTPGHSVQACGVLHEPCLERIGTKQAAGDGRKDQCDVAGAEAARDVDNVALAQCHGEFLTVVDQLAGEIEKARDAAGLVG